MLTPHQHNLTKQVETRHVLYIYLRNECLAVCQDGYLADGTCSNKATEGPDKCVCVCVRNKSQEECCSALRDVLLLHSRPSGEIWSLPPEAPRSLCTSDRIQVPRGISRNVIDRKGWIPLCWSSHNTTAATPCQQKVWLKLETLSLRDSVSWCGSRAEQEFN